MTPQGVGYAATPGIWSQEQVAGWKLVTEAVHAAGGKNFLQLWHVGRVSDPIFLNGNLPVAPSAIAPQGHVSLVRPQRPYVTPRALNLAEIPGIVDAYRTGAENAKSAGFGGVEVHGANGYLLDQFLQDSDTRATSFGQTGNYLIGDEDAVKLWDYLERQRDPEDDRQVRVSLTKNDRKLSSSRSA